MFAKIGITMMDLETHALIERSELIRDDLRRRIAIAGEAQNVSKDRKVLMMPMPTRVGNELISLINELSESVAQQNAELEETESWKAHMRGQAQNAIDRMKDFVHKTSAELDNLRRERDDAIAAARLMHGRVEAALQFKSAMPQHAVDHLILGSKIHASLQRARVTNDPESAASGKTQRHAPDKARACGNTGDEPLVSVRSDP
jgi:hypothetical protein